MRLDGKTTTELTDSCGFEFNTTRPLGANLQLIERILTEEIWYVIN